MLSRLTLRQALLAAFGVVLVVFLAGALPIVLSAAKMGRSVDLVTDNTLPSLRTINELQHLLSSLRRAENRDLLIGAIDPAQRTTIRAEQKKLESALRDALDAYERLVHDDTDRAAYDEGSLQIRAYLDTMPRTRELADLYGMSAADSADAVNWLSGASAAQYELAYGSVRKLWTYNEELAVAAGAEAAAAQRALVLALGASMLAASVCAALLAWWVSGTISRGINTAITSAERIAAGDLTQPLSAEGRNESARLVQALAAMQARLAEALASIRRSADQIAVAADEVAAGSQDLSGRTEEQASALQQTASGMNEMLSHVQESARAAQEARGIARQAAEAAGQGGRTVDEVGQGMARIAEASRRIGEITTVVDGIAFQTNILALNAAVEAARAGDAGRGFAVVAAEVRTLAQQSAENARQIREVVASTVGAIDQGSGLVSQAAQSIREVVGQAERVAVLVDGLSSATQEQSTGLTQIGQAVSQMDSTTQQNAALVEESAAAGASLRDQAGQLREAMQAFRVH